MAVAIYIPPRNSGLVQKQIDQLWTYQFLVFKEQFLAMEQQHNFN